MARVGRVPVLAGWVLMGWTLMAPAAAEPVLFDWRVYLSEDRTMNADSTQAGAGETSNPVVLPQPDPVPLKEDDRGWHWVPPRIADSAGARAARTAEQLASEEQDQEMAQRNSPLTGILPGSLNGLAPMAVESGIEWRF